MGKQYFRYTLYLQEFFLGSRIQKKKDLNGLLKRGFGSLICVVFDEIIAVKFSIAVHMLIFV
jgi:hypothetical protein